MRLRAQSKSSGEHNCSQTRGEATRGPEPKIPWRNRHDILDKSNESCGLKIAGKEQRIIINPEEREPGEQLEHSPVQGRIDV